MMDIKKIWVISLILFVVGLGAYWIFPGQGLKEGMVIATMVPSGVDLFNGDHGIDGRYIPEAQIIAFDPNGEGNSMILLTEQFYSARAPEVSPDGENLVFSGQKSKGDTWQIYWMRLEDMKVRQISHDLVNCTDPSWLPNGNIAFSRLNKESLGNEVHVIYTCNLEGEQVTRIMHYPNSTVSPNVVQDGRLLVLSRQTYPDEMTSLILALRPDGTKSELFYKSPNSVYPFGKCWESSDGRVFFIEKEPKEAPVTKLASVLYGQPLSSYQNISDHEPGIFHSLYPQSPEQLIVSYKPKSAETFSLNSYDLKAKKLDKLVYHDSDHHIIEPVVVEKRKAPLILPAIVDETKEKGSLLCHNANFSTIPTDKSQAAKVRVYGANGLLGEIPVEEDGSFYIEIDADMPVRFQTLGSDGKILRGPSAWIWVRPGEKRSCIGCHEDREMAPDNRVPQALYTGMISLPRGTRKESLVFKDKY